MLYREKLHAVYPVLYKPSLKNKKVMLWIINMNYTM